MSNFVTSIKRIMGRKDIRVMNVNDAESLEKAISELKNINKKDKEEEIR